MNSAISLNHKLTDEKGRIKLVVRSIRC